jgi:diacylglycerol kinase (ATP)
MNVLIIGNPAAGTGKAKQSSNRLSNILERNGHQVDLFLSRKPGDALERVSSITPDVERIVIVGGDGSVNEALNGLKDPSKVPILHMGCGTANMLAKELGIPKTASGVARLLETGGISRIDMGVASGRRFLMVASVGFDSFVTRYVKETRSQKMGYLGYIRPIIKSFFAYWPNNLKVFVDGAEPVIGQMVMVLKLRCYGGIFVFADDARLDSGLFHIRVFPDGSKPALFKYFVGGITRSISRLPEVITLTGKHVRIEADHATPVQLDGDHYGWTPLEMQIFPQLVPVVVPR